MMSPMPRPRRGIWIYLLILLPPLVLLAAGWWWGAKEKARDQRFDRLVIEASARYRIDANLVRAVIWRESDFDPDAVGAAGERGLMQIMEPAAAEWAKAENLENFRPTDLFDPRTNILAGSWYLSRAISRWPEADRPEVFGLAEYNAGRTHARRWARDLPRPVAAAFIERIDFPTTKNYILDILARTDLYRREPDLPVATLLWGKMTGIWWRWQERQRAEERAAARAQD
jgi:soluble lytic murein transglycosylase